MSQAIRLSSLEEEKINRLMLKFALPCIFSLLVSSLYNIVDQIFIGNSRLSTLGNAATGVVFPVFIIAQAFAWCLGDGAAAYLNICQGEGNAEEAHKAVGAGITTALLSGVAMMLVIYPFRMPILGLFGASENTMAYAVEYLNVILFMLPAYILCNMLNSVIRADGSPTWAMLSILAGAVANIILDPILIFSLDMGMTGAALATVIGQGITLLMTLGYFFKTKTFRLTAQSLRPSPIALWRVVRLGLSTFFTQIAIVLVAVLCNIQLAQYGQLSKYGADIPIAIIGIQSKVFTVVINLVVGIVLGCQPVISYNMGAGRYDRVRELYRKICGCTLVIGLVFTLLFEAAPDFVIGLFGTPSNVPNPEHYWEFGRKTMRIFLSLLCISCLIKTNSIFFQAVGKPLYATVASTVRDVLCFIPLILILPAVWLGVESILYAAPLADLISMVITAVLSVSFLRSLRGEAAPQE